MAQYFDNPDDRFRARHVSSDRVTLNATQARQGSWGKRVLYVLVAALVLAALAWWAAETYGTSIAQPVLDQSTTSSVAKDPLTNDKVIDNAQPKTIPLEKSPTIQDSTKL